MQSRHFARLRRFALPTVLLLMSCTQQPSQDAANFAQAGLPKCALPKLHIDGTYITFFDRHSDKLTTRAATILKELSGSAQRERFYMLQIKGHSDASETEPRDRGLGARRAANVKDFLTQAGVPDEIITTRDFGPSQPLIPTGPGKPEPQNRFVSFQYQGQGSLEKAAEREECINWLRATFCKPLVNARDAEACTIAIRSL